MKILVVLAGLLAALGIGSSALTADKKVNIKGKPAIELVLQDTTATVTATWTYAGRIDPNWQMLDEWRSARVSGGDQWDVTGSAPNRTASFSVPRSDGSDALGEFCVVPVRVSPQPSRSNEKCTTFVVPMEILPPVEIDSVTMNVASAALIRVGIGEGVSVPVSSLPDETVVLYTSERAQFTALLWSDGVVVGCSMGGDCDGYPAAWWRGPIKKIKDYQLAMADGGAIMLPRDLTF